MHVTSEHLLVPGSQNPDATREGARATQGGHMEALG